MTNQERINGSGLFFFKSDLSEERQIRILNFYDSLDNEQKEMINDLRAEVAVETEFFSQNDNDI